ARAAGVQMIAYGTQIDTGGVTIGAALPVDPLPQAL
ncbi:MAG: sugar fermentation stimulation protein A, partial [Polaromonas sp.]